MTIRESLTAYHAAEDAIHAAFGYKGDWRLYPIVDCTDHHWRIRGSAVQCMTVPLLESDECDDSYSAEIIRDGVWRAEGLAMIRADTRTDGNQFLMVFDEAKEQKR